MSNEGYIVSAVTAADFLINEQEVTLAVISDEHC